MINIKGQRWEIFQGKDGKYFRAKMGNMEFLNWCKFEWKSYCADVASCRLERAERRMKCQGKDGKYQRAKMGNIKGQR